MAFESCPLTGAERAVCRLVHHGARPQSMLRPIHLELQVYVEKTRSKRKHRMEASCLELALEGERLCKAGDFKEGTAFFEAAVQVGTEDLKTLSAIYSQLGNAYFYLKEYGKALEFHKHDLNLARNIGDRIGEGKASSNLGNTLKVLGQFDEAIVCCQRHLDISQEQGDKVGEARALYNIGNVFHAKGKKQLWGCTQDPGDLPPDVRDTLQRATTFYEMNLCLVKELGDRVAQGRAYGNLGNTHYLLGNFVKAITFHHQRLAIAKEFGDKAAERRAYSNLGNAFIFLSQFNTATEYYRKTLHLSKELRDKVMEAQACYSLGNTYTLLQQYDMAIDYYLKHLYIAQELTDRVGEGRACWSLGNGYVSLGNLKQALYYARMHLEISKEIGDRNGELTARMNVQQLRTSLGVSEEDLSPSSSEFEMQERRLSNGNCQNLEGAPRRSKGQPWQSVKRKGCSDSQWSDERPWLDSPVDADDITVLVPPPVTLSCEPPDEDCFIELLSKFQSSRMDDQRCQLEEPQSNGEAGANAASLNNAKDAALTTSPQTEELFDLIESSQGRRLDDQRVNVGNLPGLRITQNNLGHLVGEGDRQEPGDDFFNMLVKCQSSRIDDQRCTPPEPGPHAPTVPDEDFFSLIQRVQAKRMDEQRVQLPSDDQPSPPSPDPEPPRGFPS
uniref:G protein signaling modulator 1b n=2 Tax=Oryzias sinensis TaxID=183150 RepID=A0A8C8DLN9_9TELE